MSRPNITEVIGGYEFSWVELKLTIKVSRLQTHSDGRVMGELLFRSQAEGDKPIYPQTTFNFTSDRTRTALAKTLTEQDARYPWDSLIKQLCVMVVERAREGEPVTERWTSEEVPPPQWLLKPILYRGLPTIIFGEKAVAKSTLALAAYTCLSLPWEDNPLGWGIPSHPVTCLLADWEADGDIALSNMKRLQEGMGLPHFPLYYRRCSLPLADDIEQLQNHLQRLEAQVLIVDSLGPAVGGDLKDAGQALRLTMALRKLKVSALIIGQTSKDRESKAKSVFGSTMFEYYARNIFELRRVQEEGEDEFDIALFNTFNNLSQRSRPQGFHLHFNETGTHIESQPITAPELVERMGTRYQIYHLLKEGPRTTEEIITALNLKRATVDSAIFRLKKAGRIVKSKDSAQWGLVYSP